MSAKDKAMAEKTLEQLAKRLWWDILDPYERQYWGYYFIEGLPGLFGDMIRGRYVGKRLRRCGTGFNIKAGTRFRSMEHLSVGDHVTIGYDNFIQALGGVTIGDNVMTAPGVKIWSVNHNIDSTDVPIREQGQTQSPVVIGNDVWIASNAFILPGVHLPDGVVVTAGAVVGAKSYKPYAIIAGNPARIIGYRGGVVLADTNPASRSVK